MLVVTLLGISSGLPIMLLYSTIKIWLRRSGIDLGTIGFLNLVTLPYSINFLWAPLLDRFMPLKMGRRRGWILITQLALILCIVSLGFTSPQVSLAYIAIAATLVCFFSATQDIAVDAYRREILDDSELGIGAALGVYGYRLGMWLTSGLGLWVVDPETFGFSFQQSFFLTAGFMSIGVFTVLFLAKEPTTILAKSHRFIDVIVAPFKEIVSRKAALSILAFVFFYKFGDAIAGSMVRAFYVDMGFSNKEIAEVASTFGFFSSMIGLAIGGSIIFRFGFFSSLWVSGVLQGLSTLAYTSLLYFEKSYGLLAAVVGFEDITSGMGTAALVAYMAHLTRREFTATQYALFASLASLGRTLFSSYAGYWIEWSGYLWFFIGCSAIATIGLSLLPKLQGLEKA